MLGGYRGFHGALSLVLRTPPSLLKALEKGVFTFVAKRVVQAVFRRRMTVSHIAEAVGRRMPVLVVDIPGE